MSPALSAPPQHLTISPESAVSADWKQQLTERLDSYRAKHSRISQSHPLTTHKSTDSRASKIARVVASRYESAPSYGELLMAAERAQQAAFSFDPPAVQTEIDPQNSEAVAPDPFLRSAVLADGPAAANPDEPAVSAPIGRAVLPRFAARTTEMHLHQPTQEPEPSLEDLLASSLVEPPSALPSKLIEFPRELVSARRARPHLAETIVQETIPPIPELEPQPLRIFEVGPEKETANPPANSADNTGSTQINAKVSATEAPAASVSEDVRATSPRRAPAGNISASAPRSTQAAAPAATHVVARTHAPARTFKGLEWASISLDREPPSYRQKAESHMAAYVPFMVDPASIDRRIMAFAVDFAAVTAGFFGFLAVFAACTPHLPTGLTAAALGGVVYVALWVLYQMLFFSLSGTTAGMLYARIALCMFDDQNPTRDALRRRLGAWWLSCLPLGLGFLWSFVDEDNLSWHDRITRMYQRTY